METSYGVQDGSGQSSGSGAGPGSEPGTEATESFPRASARTLNFSRGAPRSFRLDPTGERVLFLRSTGGRDPVGCLWAVDAGSGAETLIADPAVLLGAGGEELSAEERARRERSRETSAGIVSFATDEAVSRAVFALSGRLWLVELPPAARPSVQELPAAGSAIDPRLDPTGQWVAYAAGGGLHAVTVDGKDTRTLAEADGPSVSWGVAEFVAAEEMERYRGFWWAPDGAAMLATRVDDTPVQRWHIADPANPGTPAAEVAYPVAGSPNADVTLHVLGLDGSRAELNWDREALPYVISVSWTSAGALLHVMSRDQRRTQTLTVEAGTGSTALLGEASDEIWLDVVPGAPALLPDGRLVTTVDRDGARRLAIDGTVVTPPGFQVSHIVSVDDDGVLVAGTDEPTESHLWFVDADGSLERLTEPGAFHSGLRAGPTVLTATRRLDEPGTAVTVRRDGSTSTIRSYAEKPPLTAAVRLLRVGPHDLCVGVLLPRDHVLGTPLPVLMDPYGGPHHQEVIAAQNMWLEPQWWADQGFAVVVADGRGTPSRGPEWDRAVRDEFATVTLDDQVEALQAAAKEIDDLDLSRVAIRGWSYGGYLAALAVMRRPDIFHAAVAGAPVTDWRLYDTFYTERYLGDPATAPEVYERNSLLALASDLSRPLLLIHGLADDNVVAAHTLRLSAALVAAGRPHDVLPLSGVTHMTPQEVVSENLLLLQRDWLRRALKIPTPA